LPIILSLGMTTTNTISTLHSLRIFAHYIVTLGMTTTNTISSLRRPRQIYILSHRECQQQKLFLHSADQDTDLQHTQHIDHI
jgi:hypothetical protein